MRCDARHRSARLVQAVDLIDWLTPGNWRCRKSAAAKLTPLLTERSRLQPPSGLSTPERQLFREVVGSVKPEHFAAEDVALIALYARGLAQTEMAAREIASGSTDRFWIELQTSAFKTVNTMAIRLCIGAKARAPSNQRKPGGYGAVGIAGAVARHAPADGAHR